jgi:hypothetical protein
MTKYYKGHSKVKTAKLHEVYDTRFREDALDFAMKELGYTKAGASSWFSHWDKTDPKTETKAKAAPAKAAAKPKKKNTFDEATKALTAKRKPAAESKAKAAAKKKPAKAKAAPAKAEAKEAVPA